MYAVARNDGLAVGDIHVDFRSISLIVEVYTGLDRKTASLEYSSGIGKLDGIEIDSGSVAFLVDAMPGSVADRLGGKAFKQPLPDDTVDFGTRRGCPRAEGFPDGGYRTVAGAAKKGKPLAGQGGNV